MSLVASAVGMAVGVGTAAWSGHESRKAMKKQGELLGNMQYYEDPDYRETQDFLKEYGINLLDGDIPDYYKGIGESGSQEFEDLLKMTNRDITQSTTESLAKGGRGRGGALGASTAQSIGDNTAKLRYADLERSLQGKQYLMNTGAKMTEGARSAAQGEEGQVNQFNAMKTGALVDLEGMKGDAKVAEIGQYGEALSSMVGGLSGKGGLFEYGKQSTVTDAATTARKTRGLSSLGAIDAGDLNTWNKYTGRN